jgi:DNA-directed RNA polymerase specialized sigma24 family protein
MSGKKSAWQLTPTALEKFLRRMDASHARAEEHYQNLHEKLVRYFEWQGCHTPQESADTTLDRAIRKLEEGAHVPDVPRFVNGIARNVLKEYRKKKYREVPLDSVAEPMQREPDGADEVLIQCIERCLEELSAERRALLLEYLGGDNREALADRHGLSLNALRLRVFQLKDRLRGCAKQCVGASTPRAHLV